MFLCFSICVIFLNKASSSSKLVINAKYYYLLNSMGQKKLADFWVDVGEKKGRSVSETETAELAQMIRWKWRVVLKTFRLILPNICPLKHATG